MLSYFDNKQKESVNLLFLKFRFVTTYNVDFEDILKTHHVIETNNKELKN
jgi:hypothetical protein